MSNEATLYEAMYILDVTREEQEQQEATAAVERAIAENGGHVEKTVVFGQRRLAYEINGHTDGLYMITYFTSDGGAVRGVHNEFALTETILRGSIVVADPQAIYEVREEVPAVADEAAQEEAATPALEPPVADTEAQAPDESEAEPAAEEVAEAAAEEAPEPPAEEPATEASADEQIEQLPAEEVEEPSAQEPDDPAETEQAD